MSQMTLREQLQQDKIFRKWFAKPPGDFIGITRTPPWYVWVQEKQDGPWRRAQVMTYEEGYRYVARNLKRFHDMALGHKRHEFRPPVVRDSQDRRRYHLPVAPGHIWCTYCRRMTRFSYFRRHHAFPARWGDTGGDRRCTICGIRLEAIRRYS